MALFGLIFLSLSAIVFVIVAVTTRPSQDQTAIDRRVSEIIRSQTEHPRAVDEIDPHLVAAPATGFDWLAELAGDTAFTRVLSTLLLQSQSPRSSGTVMFTMIVLMLFCGLASYLLSGMLLVVVPVMLIALYLPIAFLRFKRDRRIAAFNAALPECIEMCARALRAGHSLVGAIGIIADQAAEPAKLEFGEVFKKQNYGLPLRDALLQMLARVPSNDLRVVITGILVQKDTGGNLTEILDNIVFVIRERLRIHADIRTHTAQGRLTGWILCLLPVGVLAVVSVTNPGYSGVLFHDPAGQKWLLIGVGLLLFGGFLIRQIINGIEV